MLRRRKKSPRIEKHVTPQPVVTRSRRRPRPGAVVPPELRVTSEVLAAPRADTPRSAPRHARPAKGEAVVLVTGFEPFDGETVNPSWEICNRLPRTIAGMRVETCRVPCEFRHAIEVVASAIERHVPAIVLGLGQAGGRAHMSVERIAINVDDARIPDNGGERPVDERIAPYGPPAYFATVPVKAMVAAMRAAGVPTDLSNTAGTFVCNHLMYGVLHFLAASGGSARAGFVHVPYSEAQVIERPGAPSLSLATMVKGVEAAIEAAQANIEDLKIPEGKLD
jgi:pyroglutamyl-peptidase